MGLIYLLLKLYPVFGISLGILSFDLARTFKRKGNRAWMGLIAFFVLFIASTIIWAGLRGDRNADRWYAEVSSWIKS